MRVFILFLLIGTGLLSTQGQKTSDVDFKQDGEKVVVTYKLSAPASVTLLMSENNGNWKILESVSGDVGKGVKAGLKRIVWDVFEDYPDGIHAEVSFLVMPNMKAPSVDHIPSSVKASSPVIHNYKAYWTIQSNRKVAYAGDVRKGTFASATDYWSFDLVIKYYDFLTGEVGEAYKKTFSGTSMRKKPFGEYRSFFQDQPEPSCILTVDENGELRLDNNLLNIR